MNKEEYLAEKKSLEDRFKKEKKSLEDRFNNEKIGMDKRFAAYYNPVKIGDTITDHYKSVVVEKIFLAYDSGGLPTVSFRGVRVNNNGKPLKRNADDNRVFLPNVKFINGNPYKYTFE